MDNGCPSRWFQTRRRRESSPPGSSRPPAAAMNGAVDLNFFGLHDRWPALDEAAVLATSSAANRGLTPETGRPDGRRPANPLGF